ncbi:unnamed protein product [Bursaphelenchus xylophilus]|uniref:(pine wood nematode) hypothetical protein n=1 Tax=Bursaphelenchus xylophilus TaxID=6326 RepID=A0A1I7S3Q0_BURXY|nr:unnamed protein product [Bursaphelenchus xylophilus]CAG9116455.1 unnamed protein product [Bursaphelenchus xylophilus]
MRGGEVGCWRQVRLTTFWRCRGAWLIIEIHRFHTILAVNLNPRGLGVLAEAEGMKIIVARVLKRVQFETNEPKLKRLPA